MACLVPSNGMRTKGFTLIELLVVLGLAGILFIIGAGAFSEFQKTYSAERASQEMLSVLRQAQSKSLASESASQYGVFFDSEALRYTLFQGESYETRDLNEDAVFELPRGTMFTEISLGTEDEVVFRRIDGIPEQTGFIRVQAADHTRSVYIGEAGTLSVLEGSPVSGEERARDSRHVHISYSRIIDTSTESLELVFAEGSGEETVVLIPFSAFLAAGQLSWKGTVQVGGEAQKVVLITHRLNDPDTEFSIQRDRRFNTASLRIAFQGEASDLIFYDEDGETTRGGSAFVSEPFWQ
ncbi:MAG: prepilin-type N-terminal cleavage/methylation domain-containing protein [Candidatus Yanofskybacteria bacterium]|nr:prepilin-type N-terminal cleavage/methylation domain-containing protein [Candidatus Yanofskybacteria bacterium]